MFRFAKFLVAVSALTFGVFQIADEDSPPDKYTTIHAQHESTTVYAIPGEIVVDLQDGSDIHQLEYVETVINANLEWTHPEARDEALAVGYVNNIDEALRALSKLDIVEVAEPVITYQIQGWPSGPPDDPMYAKQWHLPAMGAPYAWANSPRGKGVIVAVADTGVSKVEDLDSKRLLEGKSFVPGQGVADGNGHGTHVAGTIAQSTNNGVGVAGVAPEAIILPVKVLSDQGSGRSDWIAAGIDYAADEGAQVINLSLGGGYSAVIHNAIKKVRKRGVLVIAACGNSNVPQCGYPGGVEETIGVSATGPDGKRAFYSSYGKGVDIAAPGGNKKITDGGVWQNTILDGKEGYYDFQGTSMATPHVAGAAAVLFSTGLDADAVEETLLSSATPDDNKEYFGHGHLNLERALGSSSCSGVSAEVDHQDGLILSGASIMFALLIGWLARVRGTFTASTAVAAATIAGGFWFLTYLPLPEWAIFNYLAVSPIAWPNLLFAGDLASSPFWLSAALPAGVAYVIGAERKLRPLAVGMLLGYAAYFVWGIATASLAPWWMPATFGMYWLGANAAVCGFFAMGLAGVERLDQEGK